MDGLRCLRRSPRARKPQMNLLSQRQTDNTKREKKEGSIRNRKTDSVNTGGEVEMSLRKQHAKERKEREGKLDLADDEEINN